MMEPGPSEVGRTEEDEQIARFYAEMSDEVLTRHIELIMEEVQNRPENPPIPSVSTQVSDDFASCSLRDPKTEFLDEQYLVLHERASGVQFNAATGRYSWDPRLNDTDGPRIVNELNNYNRDRLFLINSEEESDAGDDVMPKLRVRRTASRTTVKPTTTTSKPSAKYWSKRGGDPQVKCECSICHQKFTALRALLDHRHQKHSQKAMLECGLCQKTFLKRTHIYLHLSQEYKVHHCVQCDVSFASKWHLEKHRCYSAADEKISRPTRKRVLSPVEEEEKEIKEEIEDMEEEEEEEDTVISCDKCGKRYTQIHWMEKHREKCEGMTGDGVVEKKKTEERVDLTCIICLRHYNSVYWYDRHKEKCNTDTPTPPVVLPSVECPNCGKMFQTEYSLGYHLRHCNKKRMEMPVLMDNSLEMDDADDGMEMEAPQLNGIETEDEEEEEEEDVVPTGRQDLRLTCSLCPAIYNNVSQLLSHRKKTHGMMAMLTCGICRKQCRSISSIRRHVSQEYGIYRCPTCDRNCQDTTALQQHACFKPFKIRDPHLSRLQNPAGLRCATCHATFATSALLYNHRMTCQPVNRLSESNGGAGPSTVVPQITVTPVTVETRTTRAQSVVSSQRNEEDALKCSECSQQCNTLSDLALHRHQFHNKNQYSCNFCSRSFLTLRSLHDHHITELEKFKCSNCSKVFSRNFQLIFHERYCNGEEIEEGGDGEAMEAETEQQ